MTGGEPSHTPEGLFTDRRRFPAPRAGGDQAVPPRASSAAAMIANNEA